MLYRVDDSVLMNIYVQVLSNILAQMVVQGPTNLDANNLTVFDAHSIPSITIGNYLVRLVGYSRISSRNVVMALSFLDRIANNTERPIPISGHNIHRLL